MRTATTTATKEPNCDQCGDPPEDGDELVECPACHDDCCTTACIAGRGGVCCFQCEQRAGEDEDARRHAVDPLDDEGDASPIGDEEFPNEDGDFDEHPEDG